jgi:hypothetical protein
MVLLRLKILLLAAVLTLCSVAWGKYRFIANSRYVSIYGTKETPASTAELRAMLDAGIDLIQMRRVSILTMDLRSSSFLTWKAIRV